MEYTEKEKKAITILDEFELRRKTVNYNRITVEDSQCAKTVLNLLEKQQKEIERLKEHLQYYDGKLFTSNQLKRIEKEQNKFYIHKDKIREKIKELENQKVSIKVGFEKIFETKMNNAKTIDTLRELLRGE